MTSILEKAITIIAPHRCFVCGNYNNVLCDACLACVPKISMPICLFCGDVNGSWQPCDKCQKDCHLDAAYSIYSYEGAIADCIKRYKFSHARQAGDVLARSLDAHLPYFEDDWIVVPVPTIARNIRQRGYDHAKLLAKEFAALRSLDCDELLGRLDSLEQKGANRARRKMQLNDALFVKHQNCAQGKKILIIDDVCTTGATINAAAKALRKAGASQVATATVAWKNKKPKD